MRWTSAWNEKTARPGRLRHEHRVENAQHDERRAETNTIGRRVAITRARVVVVSAFRPARQLKNDGGHGGDAVVRRFQRDGQNPGASAVQVGGRVPQRGNAADGTLLLVQRGRLMVVGLRGRKVILIRAAKRPVLRRRGGGGRRDARRQWLWWWVRRRRFRRTSVLVGVVGER